MTATDLPNPLDPEFWVRPSEPIEDDLALLRAQKSPTFHPEPEVESLIDLPVGAGRGAWAVTRWEQIHEVSKNPEIYSSAQGIIVVDTPPEYNEFFSSMIAMDDPRHTRLRRLVSAGFTPKMTESLMGSVHEQADLIIDAVCERGECDFVVDVAARLPLRIVCDLMGIPEEYHGDIFDNTNTILGITDPEYRPEGVDIVTGALVAGQSLADIMDEVASSKAGSDGDDLTSILVNAELDGERLTHAEIASFFILLAVAGNETTRNAISWGLHLLTENPDQRRIWMDDFDGVARSAVEEIVRVASPVTYMRRTTTGPTELGGQAIDEGDKVLMFYLAANRDEDVFENPYGFDVRRDPNRHVGFGGPGPHFCLGAHLARREITEMFRVLFTRLPDIHAAGEPDRLASSFIHGIKHLPAEFTLVAPR